MARIERLPRIFRTTAYMAMALQVVALAIAAAIVGGLLLTRVNALLGEQVVETLRLEAQGFADIARTGGVAAVETAIAERTRGGGPNLYILVDERQQKIAGNLNRWPPELEADSQGGLFRYVVERAGRRAEHLAAGLPIVPVAGLRLIVARDIEERRAFADGVRGLVIWGLVAIAVVGIVMGTLASRYVLKRIATVTTTAETIMAGDLTRRVPTSGSSDEIDDLALRLNAMLDRIEQLMAGMREISDNIAHDLKTPLTRLRNRAEEALRAPEPEPALAEGYREALKGTIEAADDIIRTFDALLLIARLEAGAADRATEPFDLAAAVIDLADLYGPVADEQGFDLTCDVPAKVMVRGNRQLLVQAVANLVENAMKYGTPAAGTRGRIVIRLAQEAGRTLLTVTDSGPGIPAADHARVLERFVRLDDSRSKPGTGLGLSLVAAVARLHGGDVCLADNAPGLAITVRLPVAGAHAKTEPAVSHD